MTEYIEKNKAIKELYEVYDYEFPTASGGFDEYARMIVPNTIKNMTAADVAPVRHGRWIYNIESGECVCSACGENALSFRKDTLYGIDLYETCLTDYCPNCGARMDEEVAT